MVVEYPLQRAFAPRHRTSEWVGRTRIKLARLIDKELTAAGYEVIVRPDKLWPNQGYWRVDWRADVMPWIGQIQVKLHGEWRALQVESWGTMGDCARGFTFEVEGNTFHLTPRASREHPALLRSKARIAAAEAALLADANASYSDVQREEMERT